MGKVNQQVIEKTKAGKEEVHADDGEFLLYTEIEGLHKQISDLKKQVFSLKTQRDNLKFGLNKIFLQGKFNRMVSVAFAKEIMIYLSIRELALKQAHDDSKGTKEYPFLYKTNGKRLSEQFDISERSAREVLRTLECMGAIELHEIERDKVYVYKLGECKAVYTETGRRQVDSWYFSMSKPRTKKFYNDQKQELKERLKGQG